MGRYPTTHHTPMTAPVDADASTLTPSQTWAFSSCQGREQSITRSPLVISRWRTTCVYDAAILSQHTAFTDSIQHWRGHFDESHFHYAAP